MSLAKRSLSAGLSLIELLMVIGILLVLVTLTVRTFTSTNSQKILDTEAFHIVSELNRARSLTLSSKNSQSYGVHFATSSMTFFQGTAYEVGSTTNEVIPLRSMVQVASTSFLGGGSDVVFQRLTGETTQSGTITLSLVANPSETKTVTIYPTGVAEAQ